MQNGKGDKPRNCFSQQFKNNFDEIIWSNKDIFLHNTSTDRDKARSQPTPFPQQPLHLRQPHNSKSTL